MPQLALASNCTSSQHKLNTQFFDYNINPRKIKPKSIKRKESCYVMIVKHSQSMDLEKLFRRFLDLETNSWARLVFLNRKKWGRVFESVFIKSTLWIRHKWPPNLYYQIWSYQINMFSPSSYVPLNKSIVKNIMRYRNVKSSWTNYEKSFRTWIINQWFKRWRELNQNRDDRKILIEEVGKKRFSVSPSRYA